jgi:hypothetical protein
VITLIQKTTIYDVELDGKNYSVTHIYTENNDYNTYDILDSEGNEVLPAEEMKIQKYIKTYLNKK